MATKRQPDCPPASTETPGVWIVDRLGRPNPYGVQWRERVWDPITKAEVEEKRTEFFASVSDRDKRRTQIYANKLAGRANDLSREEAQEWRAFMAAANGVPWRTIFAGYQSWCEHTGTKSSGTTVQTHFETYLAECAVLVKRKEMSADSYRHKDTFLKNFAVSFGHFELNQVPADKVEKWLDDLGHASPFTFNSLRKLLFAFFNHAVRKQVVARNPIGSMAPRRAFVDNRKRILTPQQTAQLFHYAMTHERFQPALARLALEAFVGIRFSSAQRLVNKDINLDDRGVLLPPDQLKTGMETGEGHYIEGAPAQLWEWLAIAPESGWKLSERQYMELKSLLFVAAQVPHPPNCFRKSFCTYDLNLHRNPGRTAYLLGHTDQKQLWRTYKGNATKADSELYQAITPQTCAEIARGGRPLALNQPHTTPTPPDE